MSIKRIRLLGDPILRRRCRRVPAANVAEVRKLVTDLRDTLRDFRRRKEFGRGIAAPQIGVSSRVIYIEPGFRGPLINPRIVRRSRETIGMWDDCFSFPDLLVWLRRNRSIEVVYMDEFGRVTRKRVSGRLSELLQHEIDHLDGILAVDRARRTSDIIMRTEQKKTKRSS